ncbi:ubiquinol-cytochrome c reductase cytochrome c subunit [Micromonospora pallida]|uniref:Ubiquinol-cytochrome c reductase cytochrome c subunit n=1 Tax=Micromonospora pallida TaxID=145854 RepID=A0A1C6SCV8_9ACTN|nr:c-type cytochrome [Micromonospora pallida]SCL27173.1 ubiquinol-cytochrome c reductase cytochrome c subunit [Micromonospora pallida]
MRKRTYQRWRAGAAGAALALVAGPAALAAPTPPGPAGPGGSPTMVTPSGSPTMVTPGGGNRGEALYRQNCASCHGDQGQGSQRGPSLVGVGAASVDFQVATGRMPLPSEQRQPRRGEPVFSAGEIAALVDHVTSFGGGGPGIPRVAPGRLTSGRELFATNCAPCHGAAGAGAPLTSGWIAPPLYDATPVQVAEAIRVGPGLMPVFPSQVFTDQQVDDLVGYVQQLRGQRSDRGGNPLGRIGPLAEGLVAWIVTLGLLVAAARWLGRRAGE